jgi:hypothetical protein
MHTSDPGRAPSAAPRGAVQKTFVPARILSGFTDPPHFNQIAGEYLASVSLDEKTKILAEADVTRQFVAQLPPLEPMQIELRDIAHSHVAAIQGDPLFAQAFGRLPHRFRYVNPAGIIALQASIEPRSDAIPKTEAELLEFALPRTWDIPAEITLIPPGGPIQILSSNPGLQGLAVEIDQSSPRVMLSAPKHLNLVQLVQLNGRYFLRNGYHRIADAVKAGVPEFPALVVDGFTPNDIALPGAAMFNAGYVIGLQRPPLVQDFFTTAALTTKVRERRYGIIVNLDVKPINVGI